MPRLWQLRQPRQLLSVLGAYTTGTAKYHEIIIYSRQVVKPCLLLKDLGYADGNRLRGHSQSAQNIVELFQIVIIYGQAALAAFAVRQRHACSEFLRQLFL